MIDVIKTCNCCKKEFTFKEVSQLVIEYNWPMFDLDNSVFMYLYNCDGLKDDGKPCNTTLSLVIGLTEDKNGGKK